MNYEQKRIHKNISYLREKNNWSKSYVGKQLDKNPTSIGDHERGKTTPLLPVIYQYADLFGVNIGDLVGTDMWLDGAMAAEEPAAAYGGNRRNRVEHLLHDRLDQLEAERKEMRVRVKEIISEMAASGETPPYAGKIQELLKVLES